MEISVIGAGYVGLVVSAIFSDWGHKVTCIDQDQNKIASLVKGNIPIYEPGLEEIVKKNTMYGRLKFIHSMEEGLRNADIILVAVGTPSKEDGSLDLSDLWNVIQQLKQYVEHKVTIAIKSTVPVGTSQKVEQMLNNQQNDFYDVVFTPEFLRQGTAVKDFLNPDRIVVGCTTEKAERVMRKLYAPISSRVIFTDWQSAEMIKYASNTFLAMKISYINAIANLCEYSGANIMDVTKGIGLDSRIGNTFLRPGIGFGGSCLPKDTKAMIELGKEGDINISLFEGIIKINEEQSIKFVQKLDKKLGGIKGKNITLLGVAFKPGTNDIRDSPALKIINLINEQGGYVRVYDPIVNCKDLSKKYSFVPKGDVYSAVKGSHAVAIITEWEEFGDLDFHRILNLMEFPLIADGRNLLNPAVMRKKGFEYYCIGIGERQNIKENVQVI
ncbi:UDP-glucose 6-dehydrogenase [Bacillus cereus]|uniref:UDP-glucose dehydrogenase family protein n=1 Tax=Bacillus cereus TaxID=1396 RepID=UPI00099B997B|nr:UDP-glucose/GDP-mannose dehydrogenase family protein [Bacillus cereus]NSL61114.1 UDP-glucose/GDP-mannose dehydrogenase family protein [Bacillus cereus]OPD42623.1 UDP-glucose 6-dehydrogenase [Bacillus cereus]